MSTTDREPCIRCGALISTDHPVSLMTVMRLAKLPLHSHVDKIVELEGISRERAQEFVDHKMSRDCQKVEPPCPSCGSQLKTWHAARCWTCGWRRDPARHLADYFDRSA